MEKAYCIIVIALEMYALLRESGLLSGNYRVGFLGYYTILSNILVLLYFTALLLSGSDPSSWLRSDFVPLAVALTITVTFMVYHFMLHPAWVRAYREGKDRSPYTLENLSLHYILPLMTIFYWLLFADKADLRYIDGISWIIIPVIYLAYLWVRKLLKLSSPEFIHGYYPYDFLNVDDYGLRQVCVNVIILMLIFGLLGIIMVAAAGLLKGITL